MKTIGGAACWSKSFAAKAVMNKLMGNGSFEHNGMLYYTNDVMQGVMRDIQNKKYRIIAV